MIKTLEQLITVIKALISSRYTGKLTINFYKGGIGRVYKTVGVE